MNIVLISFEFPPVNAIGGIGSYMDHLAYFLNYKKHKVTVFSADTHANQLLVTQREYCTNYLLPAATNEVFREMVLPVFELFVRSNPVDIIESPEVGACALGIKEKFPHIPLIVKMHSPGVLITRINNSQTSFVNKARFVAGALVRGKVDLGYWAKHDKNRDTDLEYRICELSDSLTTSSMALKRWATNFWQIPAAKIQVIPNLFSINDEMFTFPILDRPLIISFIGKLSLLKGMKAFTRAIPLILKNFPEYKIILVGRDEKVNGQSMQSYMSHKLTGYHSAVVFRGALGKEELNKVLAASRICVFPSLWENYPTVVLEAMAAGAAVAASRVGGIPEIVEDNLTGVLFNPSEPKEIASAVAKLLVNDDARLKMVATARERLLKHLGSKEFQEKILQVYRQYAH